MKPITEDINKIVQNIIGRRDPLLAEIITHWCNIVDTRFSSVSYPFRISTYSKKNIKTNILHVKTINSGVSMEMSFQQDIIIERIAIYLGCKAVHQLRLII